MNGMFFRRLKTVSLIMAVLFIMAAAGATSADAAQKVLVLPFKINSPQDSTYLQQGIIDMLSSRLRWQDKVEVLPKADAKAAFKKAGGDIDPAKAREIGRSLGADHVVFGSVTMLGQNVSLDASMIDLANPQRTISVIEQSDSIDGVIPKINQFADQINAKAFGRTSGASTAASAATAAAGTAAAAGAGAASSAPLPSHRRHPDYLLTGREGQNSLSPLNPNFISAVGSDEREGSFWRSPSLPEAIIGMDVGDIDGDGQNEMAYATRTGVYVARKEAAGFRKIAAYETVRGDRLLTLDVADINNNGKAEIFVSAQRRTDARSLILEYSNGELKPLVKESKWYYRVVYLNTGPRLMGQQGGTGVLFHGRSKVMIYSNGEYVAERGIRLPKKYNIFNFALFSLSETGKEHLVGINAGSRLVLSSRGGGEIWKSRENFAGTMNYVYEPWGDRTEGLDTGKEGPKWKTIYLPSRLIIEDLDEDGKKEIIVAKNERSDTEFLEGVRGFDRGSIHSLGFRQMAVRENWRSKKLPGFLVDYQIKDYNNDGRKDLVCAVVLKHGRGILESRSAIVAYELATAEEMRQAAQEREEGMQ